MDLSPKTTVHGLLKVYPFMLEYLASYRPEFKQLTNPVLRRSVGRAATLETAARMGNVVVDELLEDIATEIARRTGTKPKIVSTQSADRRRQETLKRLIRELHEGANPDDVKRRFRELVEDVSPVEIAATEEALVAEGLPVEEIKRLCNLHVQVFEESLDAHPEVRVPIGHPVDTFMCENKAIKKLVEDLERALDEIGDPPEAETFERIAGRFSEDIAKLGEIDKHYLRKENELFPALERHGVTAPPKVMWGVHDEIRALLKQTNEALARKDLAMLVRHAREALAAIWDMIYKEERILLPMSLKVLSEDDWIKVLKGEEAVGYALVSPRGKWGPAARTVGAVIEEASDAAKTTGDVVQVNPIALDTGALTAEQINLMLGCLPVDVSFVDEDDIVRFYSEGTRVFPRSPGVIGRTVQNCHPKKSVGKVQQILDAFRAGTKDVAEFWIEQKGKFIHIRYFALRDPDGVYRGTVEMVQDATDIRALEGERRLVDW